MASPLGVRSGCPAPPYRYFLEQIGAGDLRPHRPQPSRRWFSAAGLDGQCLRRSRHRPVPRFNFRCAGTGGPAAPQSSSGQWLIARRLHRGPNASAHTSASACLSAYREIPQTCWGSRPAAFGSFVISQARDEVTIPVGSHRQADSSYGRRTAAQRGTAWLRGDRNTHRSNEPNTQTRDVHHRTCTASRPRQYAARHHSNPRRAGDGLGARGIWHQPVHCVCFTEQHAVARANRPSRLCQDRGPHGRDRRQRAHLFAQRQLVADCGVFAKETEQHPLNDGSLNLPLTSTCACAAPFQDQGAQCPLLP